MRVSLLSKSICLTTVAMGLVAPAAVAKRGAAGGGSTQTGRSSSAAVQAGGREYGTADPASTPTVPGATATIVDGVAFAPADAPEAVKQVIWAGNRIVGMPYRYGGGHGAFEDTGYDCSGTVSYALNGADLVKRPRDSSGYFRFGLTGPGAWISIYTRSSHAYMTVAGIRLDTSAADDPSGAKGPRWRPARRSDAGFKVRHPLGL